MKRKLKKGFLLITILLVCFNVNVPFTWAISGDNVRMQIDVKYGQSEARTMLKMINDFRCGNDAWQWNPDNKTKTVFKDLNGLTYDYALEKIAMQRAAEIAVYFDHSRPDGSSCFDLTYGGTSSWGENIAAGNNMTAKQAFVGWQETNEPYEYQGHRRNMLTPDFDSIGIGHVYYNWIHYWVQEFGYTNSGSDKASASDAKKTVSIDIDDANIESMTLTSSISSVNVDSGKSVMAPTLTASNVRLLRTWPYNTRFSSIIVPVWNVKDESIATVFNGKINGLKKGTSQLTTSVNGKSVMIPLNVTRAVEINRYGGDDRYKTSFLIANELKKKFNVDKFDSIIVASGDDYPDALSGSYLAKVKNAPVILTNKYYNSAAESYINQNLKENGTIYILGGTGVVSSPFEKSLKTRFNVKRLGGIDRYETNLSILKETEPADSGIMICSGYGYADSLSASAVGKPIMLVGSKVKDEQKEYLQDMSVENVYLVGGTGAVNISVEKELKNHKIIRYAGGDRYETSTMIAKAFWNDNCESIVVASGMDFPDGLCGGPLAISLDCPLVLASNNERSLKSVRQYVQSLDLKQAFVLGGTGVISDNIIRYIAK